MDRCRICGNTREWHATHTPRHQFVDENNDAGLGQLGPSNKERQSGFGSKKSSGNGHVKVLPGMPSDPVLRALMIRKGLITPDELTAVEEEFRTAREAGSVVIVVPNSSDSAAGSGDNAGVGSGDSPG